LHQAEQGRASRTTLATAAGAAPSRVPKHERPGPMARDQGTGPLAPGLFFLHAANLAHGIPWILSGLEASWPLSGRGYLLDVLHDLSVFLPRKRMIQYLTAPLATCWASPGKPVG
jgi:hypothetical protein